MTWAAHAFQGLALAVSAPARAVLGASALARAALGASALVGATFAAFMLAGPAFADEPQTPVAVVGRVVRPLVKRLEAKLAEAAAPPRLRRGAVELGIAGASTTVARSTRGAVTARLGTFGGSGRNLTGTEVAVRYAHVAALDDLDLEGLLSWQGGRGPVSPFIGVGGGVRQAWIGSFRETRYPVGVTVGVRALASNGAAARIEYRFRRILDDPVSNLNEHEIVAGLSLLFRNPR